MRERKVLPISSFQLWGCHVKECSSVHNILISRLQYESLSLRVGTKHRVNSNCVRGTIFVTVLLNSILSKQRSLNSPILPSRRQGFGRRRNSLIVSGGKGPRERIIHSMLKVIYYFWFIFVAHVFIQNFNSILIINVNSKFRTVILFSMLVAHLFAVWRCEHIFSDFLLISTREQKLVLGNNRPVLTKKKSRKIPRNLITSISSSDDDSYCKEISQSRLIVIVSPSFPIVVAFSQTTHLWDRECADDPRVGATFLGKGQILVPES